MNILVTGGAGYIGSHTLVELLDKNHQVVVVDNLSNSSQKSLKRVEEITNKRIPFYEIDLRNTAALEKIFSERAIDAVVHFAGLKAVGESVAKPLEYYSNNIGSTLVLLGVMKKFDVKKMIFSSSATVYGTPNKLPLLETSTTGVGISNPYGKTKYMIEQILQDFANSDESMEITLLRYFNPVGAHESGKIGEDPLGIPNNLMPYIAQVAIGKLEKVQVYGGDYDTPDGTGVRDYIHVVDLAKGHLSALTHSSPGLHIYNLGTGIGVSVLELITAFSLAAQKDIPHNLVNRRLGDVDVCYADCRKANTQLNWRSERTINDACQDTWKWQSNNPNGYRY